MTVASTTPITTPGPNWRRRPRSGGRCGPLVERRRGLGDADRHPLRRRIVGSLRGFRPRSGSLAPASEQEHHDGQPGHPGSLSSEIRDRHDDRRSYPRPLRPCLHRRTRPVGRVARPAWLGWVVGGRRVRSRWSRSSCCRCCRRRSWRRRRTPRTGEMRADAVRADAGVGRAGDRPHRVRRPARRASSGSRRPATSTS